jgi:hypothetical protein
MVRDIATKLQSNVFSASAYPLANFGDDSVDGLFLANFLQVYIATFLNAINSETA